MTLPSEVSATARSPELDDELAADEGAAALAPGAAAELGAEDGVAASEPQPAATTSTKAAVAAWASLTFRNMGVLSRWSWSWRRRHHRDRSTTSAETSGMAVVSGCPAYFCSARCLGRV